LAVVQPSCTGYKLFAFRLILFFML
jgi:hypothetical protein